VRLLKDILTLPLVYFQLTRIPDKEALKHMKFVSEVIRKENKNWCYRLVLKIMRGKHKRGLSSSTGID
jgi:hypothetical protein